MRAVRGLKHGSVGFSSSQKRGLDVSCWLEARPIPRPELLPRLQFRRRAPLPLISSHRFTASAIRAVSWSADGGESISSRLALACHLLRWAFSSCGCPSRIRIVSKIPSASCRPRSHSGSASSVVVPQLPSIQAIWFFIAVPLVGVIASSSALLLRYRDRNRSRCRSQHGLVMLFL